MSKYWLTATVWAWEEALKLMALCILGLVLLGLVLGLGIAFMSRPIDEGSILYWVVGGSGLALGLWMPHLEFKVILWVSGLALLACGFFSPAG